MPSETTKPFRKNSDGSWTCISTTVLHGQLVRVKIEPGMTFLPDSLFIGLDIAKMLDAEANMKIGTTTKSGPSEPIKPDQ
jgi:hypothetical protein